MTASLHKLTAGSGYDYLTRQVAAHDSTEKGHASLSSYYSERGEAPGTWRGGGLAGLGDIAVGDIVTAEQMQALFGAGLHPNMQSRLDALPADASGALIEEASRLGRPFLVFEAATEFRLELEARSVLWRAAHELPVRAPIPTDARAEIVNAVAGERFESRMGRMPSSLELSAEVSRLSRTPTTACAGYDVTFTPVKSVSALWAVAPPQIAAAIERAHDAAVDDALRYLEDEALYSRAGAGGVRQIDVRGLVAASFTHRDSRAGDPNLHTHVAIANKVQGLDGQWRSIDGRLIFKALVSVSETYNTQLEAHLRESLGLKFTERATDSRDTRPIREIEGVSPELTSLWSSRRALIDARQAKLAAAFQAKHGRPPTPAEAIRLAQQATLETREAKHEPRSFDEQRATWRAQAERAIGAGGVEQMLRSAVGRSGSPRTPHEVSDAALDQVAREVVARVAQTRASWQVWHLRAEASRRARELATTPAHAEHLTQELLARAMALSLPLQSSGHGIPEPAALRRVDGTSAYEVAGSCLFTSAAVVDAERRIIAAGGTRGGRRVADESVELALLESVANGLTLNDGQARLVRAMATSGARTQLALAAAGTGKTTALRVLAHAWEEGDGTVLGLAPSAAAAATLGEALGHASTVAKLLWDLRQGLPSPVDASTLLIIDEAGMTDTLSLADLVTHALERGASVRLIGDDHQLAAIGAGGVLRDLQRTHGAVELDEVLRFSDDAEKTVSLALRSGDPTAIGWYLDRGRLHAGSTETALDDALHAWLHDTRRGLDSLMLASTRAAVAELNRRASAVLNIDERAGGRSVALADGNIARTGDVVLTRRNDRRLPVSATDWVKNGDRWHIEAVGPDGSLRARHHSTGLSIILPADYVATHTELGYATTVHTAQGTTVDSTHTVLTGSESRQQLYVAMTRGRHTNHLYVATVGAGDEHAAFQPATLRPPTAVEVVEAVLARDGSARSVTTELADSQSPSATLPAAVNRYCDAVTVALEQVNTAMLQHLDREADHVVDGLTDCDAWPTLRHRLLFTTDPLAELRRIAAGHRFDDVRDPAALLATLLPEPTGGPLPWLPRIPQQLRDDHTWGPYLDARATRVASLASQVRAQAHQEGAPDWISAKDHIPAKLIGDVAVWRAAIGVDPADRRPTGERVFSCAARDHQDQLDRQLLATVPILGVAQLRKLGQGLEHDPATPTLARQLAQLEHRGLPVAVLLATALTQGPLPAERPAAALQWRIHQLQQQQRPAVANSESRWRAWADTIDPGLTDSPQWPTIRGLLTNLTESADTESMKNELQGRSPREARAALMRIRAAERSREQDRARRQRQQALLRKPPGGIPR